MENSEYHAYEDSDGIKEGKAALPKGWKFYTLATIAWMIYYIIAYTPFFTGWTQTLGLE